MKKTLPDVIRDFFSISHVAATATEDIPVFSRAVFNRFVIYFLSVTVLGLSTGWFWVNQYEKSQERVLLAEEHNRLDMNERMVHKEFFEANGDFHVLARQPALRAFLDTSSPENRYAIERYFVHVAEAYGRYDEISLTDTLGQEILKVTYKNGHLRIAEREELQNQSDQDYFKKTILLGPNQIFVSPLRLNAKSRAITTPRKPVIHIAMPVFDSQNNKRGILVLNHLAQNLLDTFQLPLEESHRHLGIFINDDGQWLSFPNPAPESRRHPEPPDQTFASRYPEVWPEISQKDRGEFRTAEGVFLIRTLYPLEFNASDISHSGSPRRFGISAELLLNYRWKQIIFVPEEALNENSFHRHPAGRIALFLLTLLIGIASWIVAYMKLQKEAFIAERRQTTKELEDLYENAPCGYHSLDPKGLILRMNRTELDWLGYQRDEVVGKMCYFDMSPPEFRTERENAFKELLKDHSLKDHIVHLRRKDGSIFPVSIHASAAFDENGEIIHSRSSVVDITERQRLEQELERQAQTDVLTGISNRRHFNTISKRELSRARRQGTALSVLMLDIDHFKRINDTYGHDAGDQVLKTMAQACAPLLRGNDLLARMGGEEFAVLLPDTLIETAEQVANRLRETLSNSPVSLDKNISVSFTVSIGVASLVDPSDDLDTLLKRADRALYRAKENGRNRVCLES